MVDLANTPFAFMCHSHSRAAKGLAKGEGTGLFLFGGRGLFRIVAGMVSLEIALDL